MARYSVIIATHQRPEWLKRAVLSVKAQTFPAVDVIIVADTACPETQTHVLPLLKAGDLFVQHWGADGPASSRNLALRLLSSDYALFLDDDDEFSPDFLAKVESQRPPDFRGILYTDFTFLMHRQADASVTAQPFSLANHTVDHIYVRNFIPNNCLIYPTAVVTSRAFDSSLALNEDWDFILNTMSAAELRYLPIDGPRINKTETPRRGNSNDHLLLENYRTIYGKWSAPTLHLKQARQSLLAQNGVEVPLDVL